MKIVWCIFTFVQSTAVYKHKQHFHFEAFSSGGTIGFVSLIKWRESSNFVVC